MMAHSKIAVSPADVERLRREAAALEVARHPGVVELLGFMDEGGVAELQTGEVDGSSLAAGPHPPAALAGIAAAVATTLADLHGLGVVHGNVTAEHILVGSMGPVLCGFADAGPAVPGRQPGDDVVALGRVVLDLAPVGAAADVARRMVAGAMDATEAAAALAQSAAAPGDRAAPTDTLAALLRSRPEPRRRRWWLVAPIGVALTIAAMVIMRSATGAPDAIAPLETAASVTSTTAATTLPSAAPTATLVWPPAGGPAPTFAIDGRRFSAGQPGDVVATGPIGCDAGTAALLRPSSGEVFVFPEAATAGHDTTAVRIATVADGVGLTLGEPDAAGCRALLVERAEGAPVTVTP